MHSRTVTRAVVLIGVVGTVDDAVAATGRREAHALRLAVERQRVVEARVAIRLILAAEIRRAHNQRQLITHSLQW
jgi:hypothetical protein